MQQDEYQVVERVPSVEEYLALREAVGWGRLDERMMARGLANALFTVCVLHGGDVIGCGRVIGDGGLCFYLQDIVVLPAFQGKGLGKRLMGAIMAYLDEHALPGAFVGLMAAKGASTFYTPFGLALAHILGTPLICHQVSRTALDDAVSALRSRLIPPRAPSA